jgi:hypothetical protein
MSNIVITGGNFRNKGAEAMLYTVVDQMKKSIQKMIFFY